MNAADPDRRGEIGSIGASRWGMPCALLTSTGQRRCGMQAVVQQLFLLATLPLISSPAYGVVREETLLVSRATGETGPAQDGFYADTGFRPAIYRNGRYIAFYSEAHSRRDEDNNNVSNVFVRDTRKDKNILVSCTYGQAVIGVDGHSYGVAISANGRFVAFESEADNLSQDDNNQVTNIFVRDLKLNKTSLVSLSSTGDAADAVSTEPSISRNGRYIA